MPQVNPRVFVTQNPHRRDRDTDAFVPAFNLHPASTHGELRVLMPPRAAYIATDELVKQLEDALEDYDYERGDSILLLGDTSIVCAASGILARRALRFTLLRWDRMLQSYTRVRFDFTPVTA